jgi:hypothetical protein
VEGGEDGIFVCKPKWSSSIGRCKTNGHHPWDDVNQVVIIHSKDVKQVTFIHEKM